MGPTKRLFIFLAFVAVLVFLGWLIFKPRTPGAPKPNEPKPIVLTDYADRDSKVIFTNDGRITGDDTHRAVRITVTRGSRTVELLQGYQGNVIKSERFDNNPEAYKTFIYAINRYGYATVRKTAQTNDVGACPLGYRYIYEVIDNNDQKLRLWSSSCDGIGTMGGSHSVVNQLFQSQITDYNKFMVGTKL
jgi:hypothetical protein